MGRPFFFAIVTAIFLCIQSFGASAQDLDPGSLAATARAEIAAGLDPAIAAALAEIADAETTAEGAEGLAHALLLNRHLDEGAYFFALAVERDPKRAAAISDLGVVALELAAAGRPVPSLQGAATGLQRAALAIAPDEGPIRFNLATALVEDGSDAALAEALDILRELVAADPANSLYAVRLAQALKLAGMDAEAADALGRAFAADPMSPAVSMANAEVFDGAGIKPPANFCNVDFRCDEVCPGGIIGRLDYVTCEIENSTAQSLCEGGQPFPQGFNCEARMPRFGILIPGLDPGFSILTPWGSIDILQQGNGRIDYRVRVLSPNLAGPTQAFLETEGRYQPSTGETIWNMGGGFQYSLFNNNPAGELVNKFDVGTSAVVRYSTDQARIETRLDTARGIVISN